MTKKNILLRKEIKFYQLIDDLFIEIEDLLNKYNLIIDIDYFRIDYVLTITFLNKSVIIINKQAPLKQIWLATSKNGYHFNYDKNAWICNRTNKNFWKIFYDACCIQSNSNLPSRK